MGSILVGVGLLLVVFMILIGVIKSKFNDIYNPIKKYNNDYRFIRVKNIKTRNMF